MYQMGGHDSLLGDSPLVVAARRLTQEHRLRSHTEQLTWVPEVSPLPG